MQTVTARQFTKEFEDETLKMSVGKLMAYMAYNHAETYYHSMQVARLVELFCKYTTLTQKQAYLLKVGSYIHDIGKFHSKVFPWVKKEGCIYSDEESLIMQPEIAHHASLGIEQLWRMDSFLFNYLKMKVGNPLHQDYWFVMYAIEQHHENWDGSGYYKGLSGKDIHPAGRILRYCDSVEAAKARKQLTLEEVYREIVSEAGTKYDPGLIPAFTAMCKNLARTR